MQVSFVDKLIRTGSMPVHFMRCKDAEGRDCYFFLTTSAQNLSGLKSIQEGVFNLNDFGHVIASGFGRVPDQATIDIINEKFQIDVNTLIQT